MAFTFDVSSVNWSDGSTAELLSVLVGVLGPKYSGGSRGPSVLRAAFDADPTAGTGGGGTYTFTPDQEQVLDGKIGTMEDAFVDFYLTGCGYAGVSP